MVRNAPSRSGRVATPIARRRRLGLFVSGFVALACGAALHQQKSQDNQQHAAAPAAAASAPTSATDAAPTPTHFDLSAFQPVLSAPRYAEVARAVEALEWESAASELAVLPPSAADPALDRARYFYVLAMVQLQAGLNDLAAASFAEAVAAAAGQNWLLAEDAWLHQATLQIERADFAAALDAVEHARAEANKDAEDAVWRTLLEAQAYDGLKRLELAEATWRRLVTMTDSGALAAATLPDADALSRKAKLAHAQASWALFDKTAQAEQAALAQQVMQEAQHARLGLGQEAALAQAASALIAEVQQASGQNAPASELSDQLAELRGLIDGLHLEEADEQLAKVQVEPTARFSSLGCQLLYLKGKLRAAQRKWGEGADALTSATKHCDQDAELHSWILFNAGKYAAADGRNSAAVGYYAELEKLYPKSSLADDARLRAAKAYQEMGSVARFVSLLSAMPEDYPQGDMTQEGVLLLALSEMEQHRYSSAASVLERASDVIRKTDSARGHEFAGTERYFLARCWMELGEEEKALNEYESIIKDVPLSYYMLHAYSRLLEADAARAKSALDAALSRADSEPFSFPYRAEYDSPAFLHGMELLRVGDNERGRGLLSSRLTDDADDSLMWGIALLFDRAGETHHSYGVARGRLTDWLSHYPQGDWRHPWEIGFPRPYLSIVDKESGATGVPPWFIYGIMREESTFRPQVKSHANAYGLMQIIEPTARGIGKKANLPYSPDALRRPAINIAIGSRVLKDLGKRFKTNPLLAIPGYNAGPGRPSRWLAERPNVDFDMWVELIPYRETRRYTKRVLASRAAYAFLYYRDQSATALVMPKRLQLK